MTDNEENLYAYIFKEANLAQNLKDEIDQVIQDLGLSLLPESYEPKLLLRKDGYYYNPEPTGLKYKDIILVIPPGHTSDGITTNWFTRLFFSDYELRIGVPAGHAHDFMCNNKQLFDRKTSSLLLRDVWVSYGLNPIKGSIICFFVDLYQLWKAGKEWKS